MIIGAMLAEDVDNLYWRSAEGRAEAARMKEAAKSAKKAEPKEAKPVVERSDKIHAEKLQREVIKPKSDEGFKSRFESPWVAGHKAM